MAGEAELIELIRAGSALRAGVAVGIGDDAAVLDPTAGSLVIAHDMLVEDVHFRRATSSFADIGAKALSVNLSDLAAMGATPLAALVGLGLPSGVGTGDVEQVYRGLERVARRAGVTIAGGDISRAPNLVLAVTVVGHMTGGRHPLRRDGARPGDLVCVSGALGASEAGRALLDRRASTNEHAAALRRAHRQPQPRLAIGAALADLPAHAAMDCSDGLALDALRMAKASQVAITIRLDDVPRAEGVDAVARQLQRTPDEFAATGGEDYELIFCIAPDQLDACRSALQPHAQAGWELPIVVGSVDAGPGTIRLERAGEPVALPALGWEH